MARNNGGAAFPWGEHSVLLGFGGMSMRQFYEAAALQGLLARTAGIPDMQELANAAGESADAMIAEDLAWWIQEAP